MEIYDLTLPLDNECMTCGTPWHTRVDISPLGKISSVGRNTSRIILGSHSGTHVDAPKHFFENGSGIEEISLSKICGEASIVDLSYKTIGDVVTVEDVSRLDICARMIFCFQWYKYWKTPQYYKDFPYFTLDAAKYLFQHGMKVMALDTPSPDFSGNIQCTGGEDSPVHKFLLSKDVVLIEYLNNTERIIPNKTIKMIALPLNLVGSDGSPARVIVMEE